MPNFDHSDPVPAEPQELPTAAELLRQARRRAGLTQREVAERAQVDHSMVSLYERGRRDPTLETLRRLLEGADTLLTVQLHPLSATLDARVWRALQCSPEERAGKLEYLLAELAQICQGVPYAIGGLAAALLQGAPVEVRAPELLLSEDEATVETVGARFGTAPMMAYVPQYDWFALRRPYARTLREADPSRWCHPAGYQFSVTLCPAERLAATAEVTIGGRAVRVVPLWELETADAEVAKVLRRTREILATRGAG